MNYENIFIKLRGVKKQGMIGTRGRTFGIRTINQ